MYRDYLLVTDLDGTLIGTDHKVSEENKKALRDFTAHGGTFLTATGRSPYNSRRYLEDLPINAPCIFYNGGALYNWEQENFLQLESLPKEGFPRYLSWCMNHFPNMQIQIFTPERLYAVTPPENDDEYLIREKQTVFHTHLEEVLEENWLKILINDTEDILRECEKKFADSKCRPNTDTFYSSPVFLEFVRNGVSKGTMLRRLTALPPYSGKKIIAAGDFQNDETMLQYADIGIAPKNADLTAKKAADMVAEVTNGEHLMAYILEHIINQDA